MDTELFGKFFEVIRVYLVKLLLTHLFKFNFKLFDLMLFVPLSDVI